MPVISRFFGIVIMMYYNDHNPLHFHAKYGEHEILLTLQGSKIEGYLPPRALAMVQEWLGQHADDLEEIGKMRETSYL